MYAPLKDHDTHTNLIVCLFICLKKYSPGLLVTTMGFKLRVVTPGQAGHTALEAIKTNRLVGNGQLTFTGIGMCIGLQNSLLGQNKSEDYLNAMVWAS